MSHPYGWWVRATPRQVALSTRRGGEERVKLEGFGDDWLLMGGGGTKEGGKRMIQKQKKKKVGRKN